MKNKGKCGLAPLVVLLATAEAFQGTQRSILTSPIRSSFERTNPESAFAELPPSHPNRLLYDSRYAASRLYLCPSVLQEKLNNFQTKLTSLLRKVKAKLNPIRKQFLAACFALAIMFAPLEMAGAAPSSGRVGGSFESASHRTPISRPYRSSGTWGYSRQPHGTLFSNPRVIVHGATGWHYGSVGAVTARRSMAISEITVLLTVIAIMIQGVVNNNKRDMMAGPLGAGATVITLTVAMNVPDRGDSNSIMKRLRKFSLAADTSNRKGVQDLISEVSLELLRQEKSIVSASAKVKHFHNPEFAERQFRSQSVQSRSKFDREVVNKFGDRLLIDETAASIMSEEDSDPTVAVVSINMSIEGKSLASTEIHSRDDLIRALSQIAADSQVGTCLLSGEVLWSPEVPGERITNEDLFADFPDLIPL